MLSEYHAGRAMTYSPGYTATILIRDYRIPLMYQHDYVDYESLYAFLTRASASLQEDAIVYVAIFNFNSDNLVELEWKGLRRELPKFTALIDDAEKFMIAKLMPGVLHDRVSRAFIRYFESEIMALGLDLLLLPAGSGRIAFQNQLSKEPDEQYKPSSRGNNLREYPTFVVEVGVSETQLQLRQDAHLWLTNTNRRTRIVLLIYVNRSQRILRFERWQNEPRASTRSLSLRSSTSAPIPTEPANVQVVEYYHTNRFVTGEPLVIPANLLFDVVPSNLPSDAISIGSQALWRLGVVAFSD